MIIFVTDRKIGASDFLERIEAVAEASPDMIILREKDLSEEEYGRLAAECERICRRHDVRFCVNSFIRVAYSVNNGRIQVPFGTLTENGARLNGFEEVWVSVHSLSEAVDAEAAGATHLIYGNVFETSCKPGADGKGREELRSVCKTVGIPVFAIGGINAGTAGAVIADGCSGVCVRSLFMTSRNPGADMETLRKEIGLKTC